MNNHQLYMRRCFELARLGAGYVSPNPMVGAVIVHKGKIIGEGYHQQYTYEHAEVNAINSVKKKNKALLRASTIYVSLEPCCFKGHTPPCSDLILQHQIPTVVISCLDENPKVAGKGVQQLKDGGCKLIVGILEEEGKRLIQSHRTLTTQQRPYIILKYAKSKDGFMGLEDQQVWLSNPLSKRLVHKWRHEVDALLVGTRTALLDDPKLNNRLYFGSSPLRIAIDTKDKIPITHHLLDDAIPTWIFGSKNTPKKEFKKTSFIQGKFDESLIKEILNQLVKNKKGILLIEGGARTLQSFIDLNLWDEARIFHAPQKLMKGIKAPKLTIPPYDKIQIGDNTLSYIMNPSS